MNYYLRKLLFAMLSIVTLSAFCNNDNGKTQDVISSAKPIVEYNDMERVEPPNWWVGFKENRLQLLVKNENIGEAVPTIDYRGITIVKVHKAKSSNYLFIDLVLDESTKPGIFNIVFTSKKGDTKKHTYEVKARNKSGEDYKGFKSSDAIYLITPDRFSNGDTTNDIVSSLKEKTIDRENDYGRHGGDVKGITNHLDYIQEMGFTAIWPTPVLTNDMYKDSYHGYAMTDLYNIDPRFGTLKEYKTLSSKAEEKGIKLIMDQVANHCGSEHWWVKDLPFDDWLNYQKEFENKEPLITSNHRRTVNQDSYASNYDRKLMTDGWFVSTMPDLNQRNPFMAKYIIQNSIWWVETLSLGGIRHDTHPYPDKMFMASWAGAIMREYPNFSIVCEEWSTNPLLVAYWQTGTDNKDGYESNVKSTMDFPMQSKIVEAFNEKEAWDTGLVKIYEGLANDFHYTTPKDIMIFPGNHDMDRIFTQLKEDVTATKMALSIFLTIPRIVQMYYGTEILMQNTAKPGDHGLIRTDFPGGWDGDAVNAFTGKGLSKEQKDMQSFVKTILNYRKTSNALSEGKTIHFAPVDGIYVLFRVYEEEVVAVIVNKNESVTLDLNRFSELNLEGEKFRNIITDETILWQDTIQLTSPGTVILTTKI